MINDPVVDQLHEQRMHYMEGFGFDLDAVVREIREREAKTPGPVVAPPPAPPVQPGFQRAPASRR